MPRAVCVPDHGRLAILAHRTEPLSVEVELSTPDRALVANDLADDLQRMLLQPPQTLLTSKIHLFKVSEIQDRPAAGCVEDTRHLFAIATALVGRVSCKRAVSG